MSLFERIQNKRYDLQEGVDDKKNITPNPGDAAKEKSILRNYNKKQKKINQTNVTSSGRVKATSDILKTSGGATSRQKDFAKLFDPKNLSKTLAKTTSDPKGETLVKGTSDEKLIRTTKPTSDEGQFRRNAKRTKITGDVIPKKDLPKTKVVNQADVSKQAQEFTKKVNKERIIKQGNIFGGEDEVKPKRRVGSTKSRGTRTKTKTTTIPGQQKLNLGGDVTKKTPKPRLSKSGEVVTDLRTTGRKPRNIRKRPSNTKPPKPEKMVTVKDPVKGGFKEVGATTKQGRKVLRTKKFVSTAKLLDPTPKPKPSTKPNLFSRIKNFVKGEPKIPGDYNLVRGTKDQPLSVTRKVYKGKLGAVRKFVDKLPRKYKLAGTALIATAAAVPSIKKAFAPKPEKKSYTVANKTLKLDTGKKNT